jgi:hypothetical protein
MNRKITALLLACVASFLAIKCTTDAAPYACEDAQPSQEVSYKNDIFPIVSRSCAVPECHVGNFEKGDFKSYDDLKELADNGKLYFRLSNGQMPPANSQFPSLSFCEVNTISKWVREGAKNN